MRRATGSGDGACGVSWHNGLRKHSPTRSAIFHPVRWSVKSMTLGWPRTSMGCVMERSEQNSSSCASQWLPACTGNRESNASSRVQAIQTAASGSWTRSFSGELAAFPRRRFPDGSSGFCMGGIWAAGLIGVRLAARQIIRQVARAAARQAASRAAISAYNAAVTAGTLAPRGLHRSGWRIRECE